ncbi:MAG TPA: amidase [Thermoleophilaceae bacterium]|nr:amidase [Thermoleophilaceae bacterium]
MSRTIGELAAELSEGRTTSEELVEACLTRIADPDGEGELAFLLVDADGAREAARAMDALRRVRAEPSPYAGIPVSIKDLFDVQGQITRAGSRALDGAPARRDATSVARLRQVGLVLVGRTNMTEFAFSGLGINSHFGTPANPWDRPARRIPGGSSSGAVVSVTDGMAHGALGTDTGGSCRIPAALCGIAGWKPTQARVPGDGVVPLSPTLDTVGVLARSVGCCAILDGIISGEEPREPEPLERPPRLAVVRNYVLDGMDEAVGAAFERAERRLADAGAELVDLELPELDSIPEMNAGGGFAAAEAFAWHHDLIEEKADLYDPLVLPRIRRGEGQSARDLIALRERRAQLIARVSRRLDGFDAYLCPTTPRVAPPIDTLGDADSYRDTNMLMLRNPTVINTLDGCSISVPMHEEGEAPSGLMVSGVGGSDAAILRTAAWIEERL